MPILELQTQLSGIAQHSIQNGIATVDAQHPASEASRVYTRDPYVIQLAQYFTKLKQEDQSLFFVTLTYKPNRVPINELLRRFYTNLLRYAVHPHNYHRPRYRPLQPTMFAWVDAPGSKHKSRPQMPRRTATDAIHHHGVIAVHHSIASKCDASAMAVFIHLNPFIRTFEIRAIAPRDGLSEIQSLEKVIDYASYYARSHRPSQDDLTVILPISKSEKRH